MQHQYDGFCTCQSHGLNEGKKTANYSTQQVTVSPRAPAATEAGPPQSRSAWPRAPAASSASPAVACGALGSQHLQATFAPQETKETPGLRGSPAKPRTSLPPLGCTPRIFMSRCCPSVGSFVTSAVWHAHRLSREPLTICTVQSGHPLRSQSQSHNSENVPQRSSELS